MEQLEGIEKELEVEGTGKDKLIEKLKERTKGLKLPEEVRRVLTRNRRNSNLLHVRRTALLDLLGRAFMISYDLPF